MALAPDHAASPDLSIRPGGASGALRFRGFGDVTDLDLDLTGGNRPDTVTAVLLNCVEGETAESVIWGLTLAARIGGLLSIWAADTEVETLDVRQICPSEHCGSDLEVALPVAALMDLAREAEMVQTFDVDGVSLRRPTGRDQKLWLNAAGGTPETTILSSLATGDLPDDPALIAELGDQLAEFDPLSCFLVAVTCPDCGRDHSLPVDLEAELLARLGNVQARLFAEVDVLAQRYGWTDAQVLSMPARRRDRYLQIVRKEEGWL